MTLTVAACDKPEAKPPTNIEKDEKADTDIVPKGKSGSGSASKMGEDSGSGSEGATPAHSFAFNEASHKVAFTAGTYTQAVVETNKPAGDARNIEYTSSEGKIATVDDAGVVTFVTQGTVTITATKTAESGHDEATARYTLYITMKPANKAALADEITRAMTAHGNQVDLNYIDVSDITDMSYLFSSLTRGYGRQAFNGDISKWNVSKVTSMREMFRDATAFNQPLNTWTVSSVTNMSAMFRDATAFNQPLNNWDVSKVIDMSLMFYRATAFNQSLNRWNVAEVTDMSSMFEKATTFNQDLTSWVAKSGRIVIFMFTGATAMQTANKPSWAR